MVEPNQSGASRWTPTDTFRLMAVTTGCLGLVTLLLGAFWLMAEGVIPPEALGDVTTGGGTGLAALGLIFAGVIKVGLGRGGDS